MTSIDCGSVICSVNGLELLIFLRAWNFKVVPLISTAQDILLSEVDQYILAPSVYISNNKQNYLLISSTGADLFVCCFYILPLSSKIKAPFSALSS